MATVITKKTIAKIKPLSVFLWQGVNRKGRNINGEISAHNVIELKAQLRKQGITPKKVKKKSKPLFGIRGGKAITSADIYIISQQISTMLSAGVPLMQTIEMVGKSHNNDNIQILLRKISHKLSSGIPLSDCLRDHSRYFDDLYCDLVASGEQSGSLEIIFNRIAIYKEKTEQLKVKIKKAMIYPVAVLVIAAVVTSILLIFVVPVFQDVFASFGAELPMFTLLVVGISDFMIDYWSWCLAVIFALVFLFKHAYRNNQKLRDKIDAKILKLPIMGDLLKKSAIARYARTLATTFAAGIPLIDALKSAARASGNAAFRDAILEVRSEVTSGMQMNLAMRNVNIFPDMVIQMVTIGEESGTVDDMLAKVASIYEAEVDNTVNSLTSLLEPLIMVVLGFVIGGLIIAMYLPIFQIGKVV